MQCGARGRLPRRLDPEDIIPTALAFTVEAGHLEEENLRYAAIADGIVRVRSEWADLEPLERPAVAVARDARPISP